jgi:hypothetical protein
LPYCAWRQTGVWEESSSTYEWPHIVIISSINSNTIKFPFLMLSSSCWTARSLSKRGNLWAFLPLFTIIIPSYIIHSITFISLHLITKSWICNDKCISFNATRHDKFINLHGDKWHFLTLTLSRLHNWINKRVTWNLQNVLISLAKWLESENTSSAEASSISHFASHSNHSGLRLSFTKIHLCSIYVLGNSRILLNFSAAMKNHLKSQKLWVQ